MFSLSSLSGFPFLILVVGCFCKTINIECEITNLGGKCGKTGLKLVDVESLYACKAQVGGHPKSSSSKAAAPAPQEIKSCYYTFGQGQINTSLALELNWTMSEEEFATSTDKSFIVYLSRAGAEEKKIHVQVNDLFRQDRKNNKNTELNFVLHYCDGKNGVYMEPGCRYDFTVMTLPTYGRSTDVIKKTSTVAIPNCHNQEMDFVCEEMNAYRFCGYNYLEIPSDDSTLLVQTTNSTPTGLIIGISISLIVIIVIILAVFTRVCIGKRQERGKQTILLLMNQTHEDKSYQDSANNLASILQKSNRVNVIFNMWETSLSVANPTDWTTDKLQSSQQVVFLCTPRGNDNLTRNQNKNETVQDSFIIGVKVAKQICLNSNCDKKITVMYFKPQDKNCIPTFYNLSKVKVFCLAKEFTKFYLHITGGKVASDIDTDDMFFKYFRNHSKNDDRTNLLLSV